MEQIETDVLVLGAGGAGLCAALRAADHGRRLSVTVVVKGLLGRAGCTRMVQGGYNVVVSPDDSLEAHFRDTLRGGGWINDQEIVWALVSTAPARVLELESRYGCFFDRTPDGRLHQKPFAGQTFDRTVHKGDLTGIEIMNRLAEQTHARPSIRVLEEHRALELLADGAGRVGGALLLDMRRGEFVLVKSRAMLLATGGGPAMYKVFACSADKSADGIALAYRAGAPLQDMEMIQFHPTGLVVPGSLMTGALLEEGLRGAGGRLYNGQGERYMGRYDAARLERSTRDVVARANYLEGLEGRGGPNGGVFLDVSHLGAEFVQRNFRGMVKRCRDFGWDLATQPVEVMPTAHFMMGGIRISPECFTGIEGLFAAGEDAGGVHGANRLGGNGVADSTVFGGIAGDTMADWIEGRSQPVICEAQAGETMARVLFPLGRQGGRSPAALKAELREAMWAGAGLVRDAAGLDAARSRVDQLREAWQQAGVPAGRTYNLAWQEWLNLGNQLLVSEMIVRSALLREESRGSHFRQDHPLADDARWLVNVCLQSGGDGMKVWTEPVRLTRLRPDAGPRALESVDISD